MTHSAPRIRPATPDDAACLAALSIEVWVGTYLRTGIAPPFAEFVLGEYTAARMAARITSLPVFVSEARDGIDGYITLDPGAAAPVADLPGAEIKTLYVQPRHAGLGRGTALIAEALRWGQARGQGAFWLTTNSENAPALAFYARRGFREVGQTAFRIGASSYPNTVLALDAGDWRPG